MTAVYPGALPVRATAGANLSTNPHSALHNNMYDEIVAIATELGTDASDTYATVKARMAGINSATVMRFASVAARDTALSAVLAEGMVAATQDTGRYWYCDGTGWLPAGYYDPTNGRFGVQLSDAAQAVASGVTTDVDWGTENQDIDGWVSGGSQTLTVPAGWAGAYLVTYSGVWSTTLVVGTPAVYGYINGTIAYASGGLAPAGVMSLTYNRLFSVADTFRFAVFHQSGGTPTVTSGLSVVRIGR